MLKADNTRYADAVSFHSPVMDCCIYFPVLKLTLAGQTVDDLNYPGQATSLLGLANYSTTFSNGCGLTQSWYPDIWDERCAAIDS